MPSLEHAQMTTIDRAVVTLIYRQNSGGVRGRAARYLLRLVGVDVRSWIGSGLKLLHSTSGGLVTISTASIGCNVTIMHGVTIGRADLGGPGTPTKPPTVVIEDNVFIGAGATILAKAGQTLIVGRGAVVGANSVVLDRVPMGETWAGNPARRVAPA